MNKRAVRLELTNTGFAIRRLSRLATRAKNVVGEDGVELSPRVPKTRMLALHHTPICETKLVRQVRLELTLSCLRGRCLDPIWLLTHGGTERTRTVIGLIDSQVPHLSATVPFSDYNDWVGRRELNPQRPQSQCGAMSIELRPTYKGDKLSGVSQVVGRKLVASERLELSNVSLKN